MIVVGDSVVPAVEVVEVAEKEDFGDSFHDTHCEPKICLSPHYHFTDYPNSPRDVDGVEL